MSRASLQIQRLGGNDKVTIGDLHVYKDGASIFNCYSLELGDHKNKNSISRIPAGIYTVQKRYSEKFKNHFILLNVEGREYILIHSGNTYHHTRGCILVGEDTADINNDSFVDVIKSKPTLKRMRTLLPNRFKLVIKDV